MTTLPIPATQEHLGPAMRALNERRRAFVRHYVDQGRRNACRAYLLAGYQASNNNSARVNACLLLHNDKVQEAIKEYCLKQLVALAPIATEVAGAMLEDPQVDPAVRAKLVLGIFDRTGMNAKTEHKVTVEHIGDDPQQMAAARELVKTLGLDQTQIEALLGRRLSGKVIDVEAEEVTPEPGGAELEVVEAEDEAVEEDIPADELLF